MGRSLLKGEREGVARPGWPPYEATRTALMDVTVAVGCFLWGRSQPAESQDTGMENSDQPHSVQTLTSGEGVMGGWLRVRGEFR